ncbi:MAG: prolyl oligopeptidase family serine peptidase [Atopobiaceae bacterium]
MSSYKLYTSVGDFGPWVSKLILGLPCAVRSADVDADQFCVYVRRLDSERGRVAVARDTSGNPLGRPSSGYVQVRRACACDGAGTPRDRGYYVALDLPECELTRRLDNVSGHSTPRTPEFRVTQVRELPCAQEGSWPLSGLEFCECSAEVCPQLAGWHTDGRGTFAGRQMRYAHFDPSARWIAEVRRGMQHQLGVLPLFYEEYGSPLVPSDDGYDHPAAGSIPLLVWLHGAGEGGMDPVVTVTGNDVPALSGAHIQSALGGGAYVLVPTCPTYWMDPGDGSMRDDNQTMYEDALMELVDDFVRGHSGVDRRRIYLGGLSNGGFMTCRILADHPGVFAAGVALCPPWNDALATEQETLRMSQTPLWMVHSADDPIVNPVATSLPTYAHLQRIGAADVHLTYFDHLEDETLTYRDGQGRPLRYLGHFVWVKAYHDAVSTELDGTRVMWDGEPVTLWRWLGKHHL